MQIRSRPLRIWLALLATGALLGVAVAAETGSPPASPQGKPVATKRVPPRKPLAGLSLLSEQQLSRIVGSGREVGAQLLPATPAERAAATVQPFVDSVRDPDAALPGRPAISPTDPATQPATEIVAGLSYQHSRFNLNLGYVVPTTPLQDYIAPLGLSLTDEVDTKRVIFGIDISF